MSPLYGCKPGVAITAIVPEAADVAPVTLAELANGRFNGNVVNKFGVVNSTTDAVFEPLVIVSSRVNVPDIEDN
jgi:hypothetical protein